MRQGVGNHEDGEEEDAAARGTRRVELPLIESRHAARPGEEMTPGTRRRDSDAGGDRASPQSRHVT